MKPSRFNLFFPYKENTVAYNSIENDFIFLTNELYCLYSELVSDIKQLKEIHPEFWETLVNKGFIVPEDTDEIEKVKALVNSIDCVPEHYHLIINPTLDCNFKCWYCYETHIKGSKMSKEVMGKVQKHIKSIIDSDEIKYFTISWFGGEPLLYYKQIVVPILEFVKTHIANTGILFQSNFTSNGLLINDQMTKDFNRLNIDEFQITLDGHREQHNKVRFINQSKGSYDILVSNIKKCLRGCLNFIFVPYLASLESSLYVQKRHCIQ